MQECEDRSQARRVSVIPTLLPPDTEVGRKSHPVGLHVPWQKASLVMADPCRSRGSGAQPGTRTAGGKAQARKWFLSSLV